MERFDVHVALEVCEIAIESATIVAILESASKMAKRPHNSHWLAAALLAFVSLSSLPRVPVLN
jgi:hypothetical protein